MSASDEMLSRVAGGRLVAADADVGRAREKGRQRRLLGSRHCSPSRPRGCWLRMLTGRPVDVTQLRLPTIDPFLLMVGVFFLVLIGTLLGTTVVAGRSPHVTYRPGADNHPVR